MSGAPVVAEGGLVGVVVEHAPREGASAITAVPLNALEYDPVHPGWGSGVDNAPQWWARLGVSGLGELRWLPARKTRREPAYWATVRAIHARTEQLEGRTRELADLAAFATGPGGYRWLTGQAWAGKTALAVEICTSARPPSVDVVAYFLSRQEADANSNRFLAAVVPQLAYLLEEDPPAPSLEEFRDLWSRAADHLAREKRLLLLVVDGLDEDLHPQGMPSIASLLPSEVAASAHVLVTSRPDLRPDFVAGHPLQAVSQVKLDPSPHAQNLAKLASQELRDLLHGDDQDLAAEILGVLTAAAGALTINDLTTLADDLEAATPARSRQVERLVTERAARSLRPVDAEEPRRYQFTHGSLLEQAQTDPDLVVLRHPAYRRRIDQWADQWRDAGWPAWHLGEPGTPRYLLDVYPHLLLGKQVGSAPEGERAESAAQPADLRRLAALVSDVRWVDSAVCTIGLDSVLQVLGTTAELVPDETSVTSVLRLLQLQAHNLRPTSSTVRPGLTATQLCCEALRTGHEDIARAAASHAEHCPAPQLIPRWTTGRTSSHLVSVVGRHDGFVNAVAVLPNGLVVSAGQNGIVRLWSRPSVDLGNHNAEVNAIAVLSSGQLVSGGDDRVVQLWDPAHATGVELGSHESYVLAVAALPNGLVVSGSWDGAIRIWDPAHPGHPAVKLGRRRGAVNALAALADGRVVSAGDDGALRVWDPAHPGHPAVKLGRRRGAVNALAALADGRVVSAGDDGALRVWDPAHPGHPAVKLGRHRGAVNAVAVLRSGRIVSGGSDGVLRIWDVASAGGPDVELGRPADQVNAITLLADGRVVSGGSDGVVRIWDPDHPGIKAEPRHREVKAVGLLANGRVVCGDSDGAVRVWNPARPSDRSIKIVNGSWRRGVPAKLGRRGCAGGHGPAFAATGVLPVRRPAP